MFNISLKNNQKRQQQNCKCGVFGSLKHDNFNSIKIFKYEFSHWDNLRANAFMKFWRGSVCANIYHKSTLQKSPNLFNNKICLFRFQKSTFCEVGLKSTYPHFNLMYPNWMSKSIYPTWHDSHFKVVQGNKYQNI